MPAEGNGGASFSEVPIGAAFDVFNGATPASGKPAYWDGDIPWVGPADLGKLKSRFIEHGGRSITAEGYASCGTRMVPAGTILLSIRAPIGHMAIAAQPLCFNQGCRGLVPRPMVRTDFAYWSLLSRRSQLEAAGQGTTFVELGRHQLRAERIPLPDLEIQKAIAAFLDRETARIDGLIETKQRFVALLGEKR
ncbi:MAG: restriction endonuclease subunit S, partial [Rhodospirillales bacterium]|nr:restriction endonuclease subunit S [Rhodospirillales bacterium]